MRMGSACARPSAPLGALDGCARDQYARTRRRGAQYAACPASGLQARALAARGPRGMRPAVLCFLLHLILPVLCFLNAHEYLFHI